MPSVVALEPPGRFPTTVRDLGGWWSRLAADAQFELTFANANVGWWEWLASRDADRVLRPGLQRLLRTGSGWTESAERSSAALSAFRSRATFASAARYTGAVEAIVERLSVLNDLRSELRFTFDPGVAVAGLDYGDSHALVRYASSSTRLGTAIRAILGGLPRRIELLLVRVTSPEELLTALIVVRSLRRLHPQVHACLYDHSFGSISLAPHLTTLRTAGTLDRVFDTIIESRAERDDVVVALAQAIARGETPRGFLRRTDVPVAPVAAAAPVGPPPTPTFASEPILRTRLSPGRCYWDRCTFCVQTESSLTRPPTLGDIAGGLERVAAAHAAGYSSFIFADESLPPAFLRALSEALIERGLNVRWACRSKLERAFTPDLFGQMAKAGCREVMFGIEPIVPRTLVRMDKYDERLGPPAIEGILHAASAAGIGVHVNLIVGFPGETLDELEESIQFLGKVLRRLSGASYFLSPFMLLPGSSMLRDPARFGIEPLVPRGDMPATYPFRVRPEFEADRRAVAWAIPEIERRLRRDLGWVQVADEPVAATILELYGGSGHGLILKSLDPNPFGAPGAPAPAAGSRPYLAAAGAPS